MSRLALIFSILVVTLVACTVPAAPGSPEPSAPPSGSPVPSAPAPSDPPPSVAPTPEPSQPPVWARRIAIEGAQCAQVAATVDASGRFHVAALCDGQIHYAMSTDGISWTSEAVSPIDVMESDPQIVADGSSIHLAFTRYVLEDEGCGGEQLRPVGGFFQVRNASGTWSTPRPIGIDGDVLVAVRVVDGTVHALVQNTGLYYVSVDGSATTRVKVSDFGTGSLRVGDDGVPRVAFVAGDALRFGQVEEGRFTSEIVAETDFSAGSPELVLAPGNRPIISWTQNSEIEGCASPGPQPTDGTYVATKDGGSWTSRRVTTAAGGESLTFDVATGYVHLAVASDVLRHFVWTNGGADWAETVVPDSADTYAPVIRIDPETGHVGIAAIAEGGIAFFELA